MRRIKWRYATAGQQKSAKRVISNVQTKMAFCPHRTTRDREANNVQCAKRKWRSATTEQQQSAKQTMSSVQSKMAICHRRATRDCEASNVQCAKQNGDMPPPGNNRPRSKQCPVCRLKWRWCYNWSLWWQCLKKIWWFCRENQWHLSFFHYSIFIINWTI